MKPKYKVIINNVDNIRDILQESYELANEQIIQCQNEINKLANATRLQDAIMQEKQMYAKAINDYLGMKDKAISKKLEIAKLLTEIYKHNGDVNNTLNDEKMSKNMSFDFSKIREMVNSKNDGNKKEGLDIKKTI